MINIAQVFTLRQIIHQDLIQILIDFSICLSFQFFCIFQQFFNLNCYCIFQQILLYFPTVFIMLFIFSVFSNSFFQICLFSIIISHFFTFFMISIRIQSCLLSCYFLTVHMHSILKNIRSKNYIDKNMRHSMDSRRTCQRQATSPPSKKRSSQSLKNLSHISFNN